MAATAHDVRRLGGMRLDARTILRLNGLASVAAGTIMLIFAGPLAQYTGIGSRGVLAAIGAVLLGFGSDEFAFAVGRHLRRVHVRLFALADLALGIGGAAFLLAGPDALTFLERAVVAGAVVVLGPFAIAELRAARSL